MASAVIGSLRANLGLDSAKFNAGMDRAQRRTRTFATGLKTAIAAASVAAIASLKLLSDRAREAADAIASIGDAADRVNVDPKFLQQIKGALTIEGQPDTGVEKSLKRLQQAIIDAENGSKTALDAFNALGVDIEKLRAQGADLEEIFLRVSTGLQLTADGATKTQAAMQLFGRSGGELNAIMQKGEFHMRGLFAEAERLELMYGTELVRSTQGLNAELGVHEKQMEVLRNKVYAKFIPSAKLLDKIWLGMLQTAGDFADAIRSHVDVFADAIGAAARYVDSLLGLEGAFLRFLGIVNETSTAAAGGIGAGALGIMQTVRKGSAAKLKLPPRTGGGGGGGGARSTEFDSAFSSLQGRVADLALANDFFGEHPALLERARAEIELTEAAMKQYGDISEQVRLKIGQIGDELESQIRTQERLTALQGVWNDVTEEARQIAEDAAQRQQEFWQRTADGIASAIARADSFKDALIQIGFELAKIAINDIFSGKSQIGQAAGIGGDVLGAIINGISGGGGNSVWQNVKAFSKGGLVTRPTMFGFGSGSTGIAGEAGTEAIMPVSTGPDGTLGVRSFGGGAPVYNIDARGAVEGTAAQIVRAIAAHDRKMGPRFRAAQAGGKI